MFLARNAYLIVSLCPQMDSSRPVPPVERSFISVGPCLAYLILTKCYMVVQRSQRSVSLATTCGFIQLFIASVCALSIPSIYVPSIRRVFLDSSPNPQVEKLKEELKDAKSRISSQKMQLKEQ